MGVDLREKFGRFEIRPGKREKSRKISPQGRVLYGAAPQAFSDCEESMYLLICL